MSIPTNHLTVEWNYVHLYLMMKYKKKKKKKSCAHTKSEAIVAEVLAPASVKEIINSTLNLNMLEGYVNTLPFYSLASMLQAMAIPDCSQLQ
jgi:hypothetical protein